MKRAYMSSAQLYLAKVSRAPIVNKMSFPLRPGSELLSNRSLKVSCQENHRRIAVTADMSKLIAGC